MHLRYRILEERLERARIGAAQQLRKFMDE